MRRELQEKSRLGVYDILDGFLGAFEQAWVIMSSIFGVSTLSSLNPSMATSSWSVAFFHLISRTATKFPSCMNSVYFRFIIPIYNKPTRRLFRCWYLVINELRRYFKHTTLCKSIKISQVSQPQFLIRNPTSHLLASFFTPHMTPRLSNTFADEEG